MSVDALNDRPDPDTDDLFADGGTAPARKSSTRAGILPSSALTDMIHAGQIQATEPIGKGQIQPASLDLRLGAHAYRVRASFLPGSRSAVKDKIDQFRMHRIDLSDGAVLERGCVYIVPLMEHLKLPAGISAIANPKSSSGRLDIFTRLITDRAVSFDRVEAGYQGRLYAEIAPRTFSVLVRQGTRLSQIRFRRGSREFTDADLQRLQERSPLVHAPDGGPDIANGIAVSVDLKGTDASRLIGYKARRHTALIDVEKIGHYDAEEFWEPIYNRNDEGLILNPDDFYILASREAVTVPPDHAAEMVAYDTLVGEFRVHYAGFFDPGFGYAEAGGQGTRAVLEVRSHEVPFLLEHGQIVGRLIYDRLTDLPDKLYGTDMGSHYQRQGLALSKQFRR